jgi:hypothetical protein
VALAARDVSTPVHALDAVARTLDALGDRVNALHARLVAARRHLLVGEVEAAEQTLAAVDRRCHHLAAAARCPGRAHPRRARAPPRSGGRRRGRARPRHVAAVAAGIPALLAETSRARRALSEPSARLIKAGVDRLIRLDEVEALFASDDLIVDACRRAVRSRARSVSLAGRPILFALVGALAEAWPADVPRDRLIERVFQARTVNESHRARLRVEISRVRAALRPLVRIEATRRGFALAIINAPLSSCWLRRSTDPQVYPRSARGRRGVVNIGARPCARLQPANSPACVAPAPGSGGGARRRARSLLPLARAGARRIRDNLVTPGCAADGVVCGHDNDA